MTTVNEIILDRSIRHQVYLQRLSNAEIKKVLALLGVLEEKLIGKLARGELSEFSKARQEIMLKAVQKLIKDGYKPIKKSIRSGAKEIAKYETGFVVSTIHNALPVALDLATPAPSQIRAAISEKPYQGRKMKEWLSGLERGTAERVKASLREGWTSGRTTGQMIRDLRGTKAGGYRDGVLGISRRAAEMTVRTTMNATAQVARDETYQSNSSVVKGVLWVSTLDRRTSSICRSLDGKEFPVDKGQRPPAHANCRSSTVPIIKSWKELGINLREAPEGTRASMDGQVPSSMTYGDWLKKQTKADQEDILGKKKAILFRKGDLPIDRFTADGKTLTLKELKAREPDAWRDAFGGRQ